MSIREVEVLLVEDDAADAELTVRSLREGRGGKQIEIARDGEEALDFLFSRGTYAGRKLDEPPRVVLLDLKLPRLSGHEVLRAIKSDGRTRRIPVVVLTSSNHDRDLRECYELGANSYVQKPVDLEEFQETVRQLGSYWLGVNQAPPVGVSGTSMPGGSP